MKAKKIKKWARRAKHDADRAEAAAKRVEKAMSSGGGSKNGKSGPTRRPAYSAPQGHDALAPVAR